MPRENDDCIMERFVKEGARGRELAGINRVRKHQQAMFLSDIVTANGRRIDPSYMCSWERTFDSKLGSWEVSFERQLGRRRSLFDFGP